MIKYILGIDFGHGDTSAAIYNIETGELTNAQITEDNDIVPSAICKDGEQWLIAGENVIKRAVSQQGALNFFTYFKGPLKDSKDKKLNKISKEQQKQFEEYIKFVYNKIIATNCSILKSNDERNFDVYIACPSGWDDEQVKEYKSFVCKLNIPCVDIVKESDAAYVYSRNKMGDVAANYL